MILRLLEFLDNQHMMVGKVVIHIHRPLLPLGGTPDTHFCCRLNDPRAIPLWITVQSLNSCDSVLDVASNANETTNFMVKSQFCEIKSFSVTQVTHRILWDTVLHSHIHNCQPTVRLVFNIPIYAQNF
jgi:hypothetical protein